jgi:hypothetical protein
MVDAQIEFCRNGVGIRDTVDVEVVEDEAMAAIDPTVIEIVGARLVSTGLPISVYNYADLFSTQGQLPRNLPFSFSSIDNVGTIKAIITDVRDGEVQVVQVPSADDTIRCVVDRLPLTTPTPEIDPDPAVQLEIRAEYHRGLILRMKQLAYAKHDADTYDEAKSEKFGAEFVAFYVGAKSDRARRHNKPRLIQYGGL